MIPILVESRTPMIINHEAHLNSVLGLLDFWTFTLTWRILIVIDVYYNILLYILMYLGEYAFV